MIKKLKSVILLLCILFVPVFVIASGENHENDILHLMTNLVFQLAVIIFAARIGANIFSKLKMPSVLGELVAGVIIGPYLLGSIPLPGFPHGLFSIPQGSAIPVSSELYGLATIASILLLFLAGLETDLNLFLQFSIVGSCVGIGGIIASFFLGAFTAMYFLNMPLMSPACLFLGVISTATSVGITARILSQRRNMDSPEGVTILAGAIIDDVIGIILLSIVIGIATVSKGSGIEWGNIGLISIKAIGVWLSFTIVGLMLSHKISNFLKIFQSKVVFTILSLGLALFIAAIFEKAGLAMIIGAYIMGLVLSKTDISYVIQNVLNPLEIFFVPIFFTVTGMLVDVRTFLNKEVIVFGFVYSIFAVLAKLIGCGVPSLMLNFNSLGALRIGLGMIPRGEVALIIASIGLSHGILDEKIFGVAIMMTLITTIIAPPILDITLKSRKKGTRKDPKTPPTEATFFDFPTPELTELLVNHVLEYFRDEDFFINMMELECKIYQIRKDKISIKLFYYPNKIVFKTAKEDVTLIRTIVYEAFLKLHEVIENLKSIAKPQEMRKDLASSKDGRIAVDFSKIIEVNDIIMNLEVTQKEDIITEMVNLLEKNNKIKNKSEVIEAVMAREKSMSTGLQNGIAIPHAKCNGVDKITIAIALSNEGIDFDSLDGLPSKIFILLVSSNQAHDPHLQALASISSIFSKKEAIDKLLNCKTKEEVLDFFIKK